MPLHDRIHGHFQASARTKLDAAEALAPQIERAARLIVHCLAQGGKLMACGNGGSAAAAQHVASAMLNRFEQERPGLAAIALTADSATLTAIADDHAYDQVFARQVKVLGQPGDVLLAISTHGNSPSMAQAIAAAHARSLHAIVLTGHSGGMLSELIAPNDLFLCVPGESAARIREVHQLTLHCLCDAVDSLLLGIEE
jgi:D-sedoheptulose 7-phosphate isomerase